MWSRIRQVLYYVRPRLGPAERTWALDRLNAAQGELFSAMGRQDQAHAVRVARRVADAGGPEWVVEAALLHDCAKPKDYTLFWRVAGVLLSPALEGMPQEPPARGLMRPLQVYRWHDQYGLILAREAGTSPAAMALLEAYVAGAAHPWRATLKAADDAG